MRFAANLSIVFADLPLLKRPAAAAAAGFDAVELWWPFPEPSPPERDLDALRTAVRDAGVRLVALNFDAGDMAAGERGLLSRPADAARFRENIDVAVGLAGSLGCRVLNALYGNAVPGLDPAVQHDLALENLTAAAEAAQTIGATVVIEALNSYENPNYPITSSSAALRLIDEVRAPNVALLADLYHLYRMGEDLFDLIERHTGRFGHVQIADAPGRGRPGTGEIPYERVLARLAAAGYAGHIGLEYKPAGPGGGDFSWLPPLRERLAALRNRMTDAAKETA